MMGTDLWGTDDEEKREEYLLTNHNGYAILQESERSAEEKNF